MKKRLFVCLLLALAAVSVVFAGGRKEKSAGSKVFLISMDQMDQHWVKVDEGARKAAEELGNIDYTWLAPDVKDDAKQIECVNNAVAAGANCILVAPNGPDAITAALREAVSAGVKIIYVDSSANFPAERYLATDNRAGGRRVGEALLAELTRRGVSSGMIGVVGVNAATESTREREAGFSEAFADTDFTILETQYSQGDAATAKDMAANFIAQGCVAVYGSNEGSTIGVGNAVMEAGGNVIGCGSDASDVNLSLVQSGALLCIMGQSPFTMGYEGVRSAAAILRGESLDPYYVDTGVDIIPKDNM